MADTGTLSLILCNVKNQGRRILAHDFARSHVQRPECCLVVVLRRTLVVKNPGWRVLPGNVRKVFHNSQRRTWFARSRSWGDWSESGIIWNRAVQKIRVMPFMLAAKVVDRKLQ